MIGSTATRARNGEMSAESANGPCQERAQHREIAVREVDDAHDAEHQRQPAREQRVIAAEQDALRQEID